MRLAIVLFFGVFLGIGNNQEAIADDKNAGANKEASLKEVFFKVDQGATAGRILDKKMSNLHYSGFGMVLNFGRRKHTNHYISEWEFLGTHFNYSKPVHKNTKVFNPAFNLKYMHLRDIDSLGIFDVYAGLQANFFGDIRIAPRLSNSSVYADIIGELRPQADMSTSFHLFRNWNIDISLATTIFGYGLRIPEYGTTLRLTNDGGVTLQGMDNHFLFPFNYRHTTTGLFFRESFGDDRNPNWYRVGYIWDYYTLAGKNDHNVYNAIHKLVLELYFKTN